MPEVRRRHDEAVRWPIWPVRSVQHPPPMRFQTQCFRGGFCRAPAIQAGEDHPSDISRRCLSHLRRRIDGRPLRRRVSAVPGLLSLPFLQDDRSAGPTTDRMNDVRSHRIASMRCGEVREPRRRTLFSADQLAADCLDPSEGALDQTSSGRRHGRWRRHADGRRLWRRRPLEPTITLPSRLDCTARHSACPEDLALLDHIM